MRLIDADSYKKYLEDEWIPANFDAIDAQPTVDAQPVVHGHPVTHNRPISAEWVWGTTEDGECIQVKVHDIIENNPVDYCSVCGKRLDDTFQNFCPNCGAKMDA